MQQIKSHNYSRCIVLVEDVSTDLLSRFMEKMSDLITQDSVSPISVVISTDGGDMYSALAIHDIIKTSPVEIHTFGVGTVMSAGCLILSAGTQRYLYPNTFIMDHEGTLVVGEGRPGDLKANYEHSLYMADVFNNCLAKATKKSPEQIKADFLNKTIYMNAQEAIDYGLADGIVGNFVETVPQK